MGKRTYRPPEGYKSASQHKLFEIYLEMLWRCSHKNPHYADRGIIVCTKWQGWDGFCNWLEDMGQRPEGKSKGGRALFSIERRNNEGNYEPSNCYWADQTTQVTNCRPSSKPNGTLGKIWVTNGSEFKRVNPDLIPEGFYKGAPSTPKTQACKEALSKKFKERKAAGWKPWNYGKPATEQCKKAINSPQSIAKRVATRRTNKEKLMLKTLVKSESGQDIAESIGSYEG